MLPKKKIVAKQFKLPLDEHSLNIIHNNDNIFILDEKIFQDRNTGDIIVYLKYEDISPEPSTNVVDNDINF